MGMSESSTSYLTSPPQPLAATPPELCPPTQGARLAASVHPTWLLITVLGCGSHPGPSIPCSSWGLASWGRWCCEDQQPKPQPSSQFGQDSLSA